MPRRLAVTSFAESRKATRAESMVILPIPTLHPEPGPGRNVKRSPRFGCGPVLQPVSTLCSDTDGIDTRCHKRGMSLKLACTLPIRARVSSSRETIRSPVTLTDAGSVMTRADQVTVPCRFRANFFFMMDSTPDCHGCMCHSNHNPDPAIAHTAIAVLRARGRRNLRFLAILKSDMVPVEWTHGYAHSARCESLPFRPLRPSRRRLSTTDGPPSSVPCWITTSCADCRCGVSPYYPAPPVS
jgi:hypothetical protein